MNKRHAMGDSLITPTGFSPGTTTAAKTFSLRVAVVPQSRVASLAVVPRRFWFLRYLALVVGWLGLGFGLQQWAASAEARSDLACQFRGEVKYTGPRGSVQSHFTVEVYGCKWMLSLRNGISDYIEVGCDTENIYYLNNLESAVRTKRQRGEKVGDNIATANVLKGNVPRFPFGAAHCANAVWLTFASGCYFDGIKGAHAEAPACVGVLSPDGRDTLYPGDSVSKRVIIHKRPDSLGVPRHAAYMEELNPYTKKTFSPTNGYCSIEFELLATTNVNGRTLPLASRMKTFRLDYSDFTQTRLIHDYEVRASDFAFVVPRADYRPRIPGMTAFADARFTSQQVPKFSYTRSSWMSDKEAASSLEFREAARNAGKYPPPKASVKYLMISVFVFSLLLPSFVALVRWRRRLSAASGRGGR